MRAPTITALLLFTSTTACAPEASPPAATPAATAVATTTPIAAPPPPADEKPSLEKAVQRFVTAPSLHEEWFAPSFLAHVPFARIQPIRDQAAAALGAFQQLTGAGPAFEAVFEKGRIAITAHLDDQGRLDSLLIKPVTATPKSMAEVLDAFKKLPGKVSVLILDGSTTLGAVEPDVPLAVGSAFKLAALAALRGQIDAKKRSWRDVVELSPRTKSLPSGLLQDWPAGAPLTLYALAGLMISRSDNTATDTLIELVGRQNIEPLAGRNKPYLMTREMFLLKSRGNEASLARWRAGDERARRALLADLDAHALPNVKDYPKEPTALDVEWFFTTRELCALMAKVADLPLMTINPGVADKGMWSRVAYKGGSEPGVLNTTTWLEKGKHTYCVSTTWNAPMGLEESALFQADQGAFNHLATLP